MKRVIVAVQNALVSEAVLSALKKRGMFAEKSLSGNPQKIAALCETLFADVLVADVTRFGEGTIENRTETLNAVKRGNPQMKVCFVCDNVSEANCPLKWQTPKKWGL